MKNEIIDSCIHSIMDNQSKGYSYVQTFAETLWKYRILLNIDRYVVIWNVLFNDKDDAKYFYFYSNNQKFEIPAYDILSLMQKEEFLQMNDHTIAIPINGNTLNDSFFETYGLILLFPRESSTIIIARETLSLYHLLLNKRVPNVLCEESVIHAFEEIAINLNKSINEFSSCYSYIGESLERISSRCFEYHDRCGLRHFSLWNYIQSIDDLRLKQFSRNTYTKCAHTKTYTILYDKDQHYINDALKSYEETDDIQILRCFSYGNVKSSFLDQSYFDGIGLNEENATVIVAAKGDDDSPVPDRILNYYVSNIIYTPFISKQFIATLTRNISNIIIKCLASCRADLFNEFITLSIESQKEEDFYNEVIRLLKKVNEAEDVLIYLKEKEIYKKKPADAEFQYDRSLVLPPKYDEDKSFSDWLERQIRQETSNSFWINEAEQKTVHSAMLTRVRSNTDEIECIIILLNKSHQPSKSCVYYNNVFDKDNYYVTMKCGSFLVQYQNLQNSIHNKNYLLHKLRHEIPNCTSAIEQGLNDIADAINKPDISRNHISTISHNMALSNSRILLLAKFFSTVGFDLKQFADDRIHINLRTFLSSYITIFRTEGMYKGVDVFFEIKDSDNDVYVYASNYFQLAVVNVITNAIRYAASGTCVHIDVYFNRIIVRDVGIGIPDKEHDLIFEEGFRGAYAKQVCEKGMGYGLFLTKKVLEAHGFKIDVTSFKYFDQNYFAQAAVYEYLQSLKPAERNDFIYYQLEDSSMPTARKYYEHMRDIIPFVKDSNDYSNTKLDVIKYWLDYSKANNNVFYDLAEDFSEESLSEVCFTIYFTENENINH